MNCSAEDYNNSGNNTKLRSMNNSNSSRCSSTRSRNILSVHFNQDRSCMSAGTRDGFYVYRCSPFKILYENRIQGAAFAEMLGSSSLLALVGASTNRSTFSQRTLRLWNTKSDASVGEISFESAILKVRMTRENLAVFLANCVFVYELKRLKLVHRIDTAPNVLGIGDMNCKGLLAFPLKSGPVYGPGSVAFFDSVRLKRINVFRAHKTMLAAIEYSAAVGGLKSGGRSTLLATASQKGTVIRVYSVPDAELLYAFRRGTMCATIRTIGFSQRSDYLAVCSGSGTVHVFKLCASNRIRRKCARGVGASSNSVRSTFENSVTTRGGTAVGAALSTLAGRKLLASLSLDTMVPPLRERSFAWTRIRSEAMCCAVVDDPSETSDSKSGSEKRSAQLFVATKDGCFLRFGIDGNEGGECKLLEEALLLPNDEEEERRKIASAVY